MLLEKTRTPQLGCGELKVSLRIYRRPHKVLEATQPSQKEPKHANWRFEQISASLGLPRCSKTGLQQSGPSVVYSVQNPLFGPKLSSRRDEMRGLANPTAISHTYEGPIEGKSMISNIDFQELKTRKARSDWKKQQFLLNFKVLND